MAMKIRTITASLSPTSCVFPVLPASRISPNMETAPKASQSPRAVGEVETGRGGVEDCFRGCGPGCGILAAPVCAGRSWLLDVVDRAA
jgi:hypothetical protein